MTEDQKQWCKLNTWYVSSNGKYVTVKDPLSGCLVEFSNFKALLTWAGIEKVNNLNNKV